MWLWSWGDEGAFLLSENEEVYLTLHSFEDKICGRTLEVAPSISLDFAIASAANPKCTYWSAVRVEGEARINSSGMSPGFLVCPTCCLVTSEYGDK